MIRVLVKTRMEAGGTGNPKNSGNNFLLDEVVQDLMPNSRRVISGKGGLGTHRVIIHFQSIFDLGNKHNATANYGGWQDGERFIKRAGGSVIYIKSINSHGKNGNK